MQATENLPQNSSQLNRELDLLIPTDKIDTEVENRLKRLARTVKMHGFRPGKVPLKIVQQQFGDKVRQEVIGDQVREVFQDKVKEQQLRVAGYPRIEPKPAENDSAMGFRATFEVYPEIKIADLSGSTIEKPVVTITEDDVSKTIEILRKQRVTYQTVSRPAQTADRINIDYRGTRDGQEFPGGRAEKFSLVLGEGKLLADFEKPIIGMATQEEKDFPLTFPSDYQSKELAGQTVSFHVKINEIEEPILPEVNAEFAKSLGISDGDITAMRDGVRQNLQYELDKRVQMQIKQQVMDAILKATPIEVPRAIVEMEIHSLMENMQENLKARGINPKDIPWERSYFEEQAKRRVQLGLILGELTKAEDLQPKPEQIRAKIEDAAQGYEHPDEVVKWYYGDAERLAEMRTAVAEDNIVTWALERAKVVDKVTNFDEIMGNS